MHKVLYTHGASALDDMMKGVDVLGETGADSVTFFSLDIDRYARFIRERGVKVWLMLQWDGAGEEILPKIEQYVRDCIAAFGRENLKGVNLGDEWDWKIREASAGTVAMRLRSEVGGATLRGLGTGHRWMEREALSKKERVLAAANLASPRNYSPEMARKRNEAVKAVDPTLETWINVIGDTSNYIVEARTYADSGADHVTFDYYSRICENADGCAGWCAPQPETSLALTHICAWFAEKPLARNQKWGLGVQCFDMVACQQMPRTTAALMRADFDRAAPLGDIGLVYAYCWSDFGSNRNDLMREPKLRPECKVFFDGLEISHPQPLPEGGGKGAVFEPSSVSVRVGEVLPVRVIVPDGRAIARFEIEPEGLIDGWPAELPPGAAGWTINGRKPGKGAIACVLDDGTESALEFEVRGAERAPRKFTATFTFDDGTVMNVAGEEVVA
jgi:hypothetical protein